MRTAGVVRGSLPGLDQDYNDWIWSIEDCARKRGRTQVHISVQHSLPILYGPGILDAGPSAKEHAKTAGIAHRHNRRHNRDRIDILRILIS